jgi:formate dehydrogenase subunit gamma
MMDPSNEALIRGVLADARHKPGALLVVLHAIQDRLGFVPRDAVPLIATELNLSRAEVHGVVSFYHHFRERPAGRHVVRVCRAEACQSMRGAELAQHANRALGVEFDQTDAEGNFTLESVFCLGNCACAPAVMIDDELYGRVTTERFDALLTQWRQR